MRRFEGFRCVLNGFDHFFLAFAILAGQEGNVDIGISGSDMLEEAVLEAGFDSVEEARGGPVPLRCCSDAAQVVLKLGIGKCKLCLQAPLHLCGSPAKGFVGQRVVTSFPCLTKRFFDSLATGEHQTHIKEVSGSVEAACGLGLADAVVDLVETGTTMRAAGLDVVADVLDTEALLFQQRPQGESLGPKTELLQLIDKSCLARQDRQLI